MNLKLVGAVLVIACCAWFGFSLAANHKKEESALLQLIAALDYMECELQYRLTPLPDLCKQAAEQRSGIIRDILLQLSLELNSQLLPDVSSCMHTVLANTSGTPQITQKVFEELGHSLGKFDLQGQLQGLEAARQQCRQALQVLTNNRDARLRSYQTLGICAGAALAIILI